MSGYTVVTFSETSRLSFKKALAVLLDVQVEDVYLLVEDQDADGDDDDDLRARARILAAGGVKLAATVAAGAKAGAIKMVNALSDNAGAPAAPAGIA